MAALQQRICKVRADEACHAGDEVGGH
jgi:hypothetical protein